LQPEPSYQSWQIIRSLVQLVLFIITITIIIEYKRWSFWHSKKAIENAFKDGPTQLQQCVTTMFLQ
jgi:hypothetical protein